MANTPGSTPGAGNPTGGSKEEASKLKKEIEDFNNRLKDARGYGIELEDAMRKAGDNTQKLKEIIDQLNKEYNELVDNADYIYRTFQDITAELKNQNLLLTLGKGSFKELTSIAQDLSYYQRGNNDLADKHFIKIKNSIGAQKEELEFVVKGLEASKIRRNIEIQRLNAEDQRSPKQNARLKELQKENELLVNARETLKSGIPILEQELNLSKQISNTRNELGGIAQATGKLLTQFGGSLANFLNISDATEAVEEYNKKLIQGALQNETIQKRLLENEAKRAQLQKQIETGRDEKGRFISVKKAQEELINLEKESYNIKQNAVASVSNLGNKFKSLGVFAKELGTGLKKGLLDPVTLLTFAVERAFAFNKAAVDIGKNLGVGADDADRMAYNIANIANHSNNINVTFKNAVEAMSQLNTATGGVASYSADALETQIMLTKQFGLTGDEAAGIYKFSVLTGKSSSQVNKEMVAAFANTRNAVKGSADFRATIAEAAKVSGQLAANFRNNAAEITKAVVQAQALGTTLQQSKEQGRQLLEFESSIENELKAELLTGQQMNLERARAAALQGDQVTVMKELVNQGMTLEKFQSMNVLAQESFAKALGLSADQLSDQLNKQKIAQEQGKSLAQLQAEEAEEAQKRQNIQEKFNLAVEKVKDIIGNLVAGPLAIFLDGLSTAFTFVGYILKPLQLMADAAGWIGKTFAGWADALGPVGTILKGIAGIAIVIAAYGAYAALAWIPIVGPILGAAAALGVLAAGFSALTKAKKADDMISPGYGKRTLLAPEGAIALNDKDTVIAGTNLEGKKGNDILSPGESKKTTFAPEGSIKIPESITKPEGSTKLPETSIRSEKSIKGDKEKIPAIDLTPLIAAINEVKAATSEVKASIDRLYSKESTVQMDGNKVGTTLTQGSYKSA